ncbi:hypothetical protein, partial [Luteolibacter marinus]|uniref:hypothetical protein n=1 Tax=Luteolibacter marinus TaxID=2776705 RepID=UPI001868D280
MKAFLPIFLAAATCAHAQGIHFSDTFDRPDNRNVDASTIGITDGTGSSLAADAVYSHPFLDPNNAAPAYGVQDGNAGNGGGAQITGNQLQLATGSGTSNAYLNHNFTNASILAAGGFSVSIDITGYAGATRQFGGGFAVGMSQAEAESARDAAATTDPSMTGAFAADPYGFTGAPVAPTPTNIVSDFWVGVRGNKSLAWGGSNGTVLGIGQDGLAAKTGTLRVDFTLDSFAAGSTVAYEVFFNGASQGSGSFQWSGTNENFIGLDARDSSGVDFDNFSVTTAGTSATLAVSPATVSPDNPAKNVTLSWSADGLPAGATYQITADPSAG